MQQHKVLIIMVMLIVLASSAYGLGVTPAKQVIDFEPGQKELAFKIVNNDKKDFKAVIYFRGELAEYIRLKGDALKLTKDEAEKEFIITLDIPGAGWSPGLHSAEMVVMEQQESSDKETTVIAAQASVIVEIFVKVPQPGKFAEAGLEVGNAEIGQEVRFVIPIKNSGKQPIFRAKANIEILGATYEKVAYIETGEIPLAVKEENQLLGLWNAQVNPGVYHAKATIYYDDEKLELAKDFNLGSKTVSVVKIVPENFKLGDVAIFDVYMKNNWNEILQGVYGKMTVEDSQGVVYGSYTTQTLDIKPYAEEVVKTYWNTKDAKPGIYQLKLAVHQGTTIIQTIQEIQVNLDSITMGLTGQVVKGKGFMESSTNLLIFILIVIILILVIINMVWFFYFVKREKK